METKKTLIEQFKELESRVKCLEEKLGYVWSEEAKMKNFKVLLKKWQLKLFDAVYQQSMWYGCTIRENLQNIDDLTKILDEKKEGINGHNIIIVKNIWEASIEQYELTNKEGRFIISFHQHNDYNLHDDFCQKLFDKLNQILD